MEMRSSMTLWRSATWRTKETSFTVMANQFVKANATNIAATAPLKCSRGAGMAWKWRPDAKKLKAFDTADGKSGNKGKLQRQERRGCAPTARLSPTQSSYSMSSSASSCASPLSEVILRTGNFGNKRQIDPRPRLPRVNARRLRTAPMRARTRRPSSARR